MENKLKMFITCAQATDKELADHAAKLLQKEGFIGSVRKYRIDRMPDQTIMEMYNSGDLLLVSKAKEYAIMQNASNIYFLIHRYFHSYERNFSDDMYQCGVIGILESLKHYDGSSALITYSRFYIIHEISQFTFFLRNIPSPHYARLQRLITDLENCGFSEEEIAKQAGVSANTVRREKKAMISSQLTDIDRIKEIISSGSNLENECIDRVIAKQIFLSIENLPLEEKEAVKMHILDNINYKDMASELNICVVTATKRCKKGIDRIKREFDF